MLVGATSAPVTNTTDFTTGTKLLLGQLGIENTEIVTLSSKTTNAMVISATLLPHNRGDAIAQIEFDQIVVEKASTLGGSYTVFGTFSVYVTQGATVIQDTAGVTTDYYRVKFFNSASSTSSDYSPETTSTSFEPDTVGFLLEGIRSDMAIPANDTKITTEFLIQKLNEARIFMDDTLHGFRHAWREEFEYPVKALAGTNFLKLPDNIDFSDTDRSILSVRYQTPAFVAQYMEPYADKRTWNVAFFGNRGAVTVGATSIGATSIVLNNTGGFPTSGTLFIATDSYSQSIMTITFTGNNKDTNTLSGVSGVTRIIPTGTQAWVAPLIGYPQFYTVWNGYLYFDRIIPDSLQGLSFYLDYYKKLEMVSTLTEVLPEHYRGIYRYYIRYCIKYRRDNSIKKENDNDYTEFNSKIASMLTNVYTGQYQRIM